MTPSNIVGMAALKNLDVIALTDHNTCKNCPAVMKLANAYGIVAIPGMELCTAEEVHVVCLFPNLELAMDFDQYVYSKLIRINNNEAIFGKQQICNEEDEIIDNEPFLLINAVDIPFDEVYELVSKYQGIMIPAHIDKNANSLISNLGFIPPESKFTCVEFSNIKNLHNFRNRNPYLLECKIITDSDAHYLQDINEPTNYIFAKSKKIEDILDALR